MDEQIASVYGHRTRVRVCGLCWHQDELLLANHARLTAGNFWAPPGGGLEFGEPVHDRLQKEFMEETGLLVTPGRFLFACELLKAPLHAIELFFEVSVQGGTLQKGDDPELPLINEVKFMPVADIVRLPPSERHGIFQVVDSPLGLKTLNGFFRI